ncbi:MAG: four helix bundle protein [Desulfobacteraceae bacterium 4572_187]|nr:MAG: four helix bundle protein [Desulfobacteraceae bacterium 4572_187]
MGERIKSYKDLRVFQNGMDAAMKIFHLTKQFPPEEKYSMVDQMRRASRSVCANIAEAWRKRRYKAAFIAKLSDGESEACETQVWVEFSRRCKYLNDETCHDLDEIYEQIMGQIVKMIIDADKWLIRSRCNGETGRR